MGLIASSLKDHVSAISAFTGASNTLIVHFFKVIVK